MVGAVPGPLRVATCPRKDSSLRATVRGRKETVQYGKMRVPQREPQEYEEAVPVSRGGRIGFWRGTHVLGSTG